MGCFINTSLNLGAEDVRVYGCLKGIKLPGFHALTHSGNQQDYLIQIDLLWVPWLNFCPCQGKSLFKHF